uniref:Myosin motor domain-containing protein n=1 Tax=Podarcis muralis TaxID=64176 RepID=A0A670K6S6_PODMU
MLSCVCVCVCVDRNGERKSRICFSRTAFSLFQVYTYKQRSITRQKVTAMQPTNSEGLEDMAALIDLHEGAIMYNLFQRYQQNKIYTYIGSIVASVNPYKTIPGLYDRATVEHYSRHHLGEISPHIFAVANECYRCLWKRHDNQCVLIRYRNTL